jgi:hypothetical protein
VRAEVSAAGTGADAAGAAACSGALEQADSTHTINPVDTSERYKLILLALPDIALVCHMPSAEESERALFAPSVN